MWKTRWRRSSSGFGPPKSLQSFSINADTNRNEDIYFATNCPFFPWEKAIQIKDTLVFFFLSLPFTLTSFSWHISELKEKKIYSGKGRGRTHPAKILPTASVTILLFCHHKHTRCECLLSCHRHLLLGTEGAPGWDWRPMQTRASRTAPGFLGG